MIDRSSSLSMKRLPFGLKSLSMARYSSSPLVLVASFTADSSLWSIDSPGPSSSDAEGMLRESLSYSGDDCLSFSSSCGLREKGA